MKHMLVSLHLAEDPHGSDHPAVLVLAAFTVWLITEPGGLGLQLAAEAQTGQTGAALVLSALGKIEVVEGIRTHIWIANAHGILR